MTAATYDLHRCLAYLRPGAAFGTSGNDHALTEWKGPGVIPTDAECAAAWPAVQAQIAAEAQSAITAKTNETTIGAQLDAALLANGLAMNSLSAWLATGPGAGTANLSTTQLSTAMRTAANNQMALFRQINGLVRLNRKKLETTSDTLKT